MKVRNRLKRAKTKFYMVSKDPKVSLGFVDCSLYIRRVMLKEDYHKKSSAQLAFAPVEDNYMETLAKINIIPARQNQFKQENISNNAPLGRIAIAVNSNSTFTGFLSRNSFWYQQNILSNIRILRGNQPTVQHDTTDNSRLYITTMKAMNFEDEIPSIPIDNFKHQYVLVFDLASMQDATEHFHYPELVEKPQRLELYVS